MIIHFALLMDTYSMDDIRRNSEAAADRPEYAALRTIARDIETLIRSRLSGGHQREIALDIGISESKMSRAVSGESGLSVSDIAMLLAALHFRGVRVVEAQSGLAFVPEEKLAALTVLAREALAR